MDAVHVAFVVTSALFALSVLLAVLFFGYAVYTRRYTPKDSPTNTLYSDTESPDHHLWFNIDWRPPSLASSIQLESHCSFKTASIGSQYTID
jgi:hypothetical protein